MSPPREMKTHERAQYPLVNVVRWDSVEDWYAFATQFARGPFGDDAPQGYSAQTFSTSPARYAVVSEVSDPQENAG